MKLQNVFFHSLYSWILVLHSHMFKYSEICFISLNIFYWDIFFLSLLYWNNLLYTVNIDIIVSWILVLHIHVKHISVYFLPRHFFLLLLYWNNLLYAVSLIIIVSEEKISGCTVHCTVYTLYVQLNASYSSSIHSEIGCNMTAGHSGQWLIIVFFTLKHSAAAYRRFSTETRLWL